PDRDSLLTMPSTPELIQAAQAHIQSGRPDLAIPTLQSAYAQQPANPEVNKLLGLCLFQMGQAQPGLPHAHKAAAAAPDRADLHHYGPVLVTLPCPPRTDWPNGRSAASTLRIAVVSPDLFDDPASYFLRPRPQHEDGAALEYYVYSCGPMRDQITQRHSAAAD